MGYININIYCFDKVFDLDKFKRFGYRNLIKI